MEPRDKTYETVSTMEDREELLSNTEVEDSLMGDEEKQQWRNTSSSHKLLGHDLRRKRDAMRSNRWLIGTLLQVIIIALLTLILYRQQQNVRPPSETPQVGGDVKGKGPTLDTMIVKFDADASFVPWNTTELMSDGVLEQWKTMFPSGTGWGTDRTTFSTTTMTHQLHCLFMMTHIYAGLATNNTASLPHDYNSHYLHCIDYLRQGVMCAADLATEPHKPTDSDDNGPGDGSWGGLHVCKDYGQVTEYLEREIKDGNRVVLPVDD
ncbi:hypothetical protein PFICI_14047 [Pestalotiopsis fici W106-1]|uniref:Oxidase ustYa n=1 Tax=Pestalotiopsis fici (strain W106-1 / CGMCC3.15140) TaxID=1229662 RepID=W3WMY9_PESFW|nr:uncharacterized protein PFICI_14047 [Pestalotiopsis fici W106-1]ETS74181.1 hypothetical protein PFICI_14047 [Pestalotiopsis fici W106-1]